MISNAQRRILRKQLRKQGYRVYRFGFRAIARARFIHLFHCNVVWVEKQPAGYLVWTLRRLKMVNKHLMKIDAQKIRERDIKKCIVYKTK